MPDTNHTYAPTGDLTIFEAVAFKDSLITLLSHEGPVTLDLSQVERADTSAIQLIVAAQRLKRMTVTGVSDNLMKKLAGLGCWPASVTTTDGE